MVTRVKIRVVVPLTVFCLVYCFDLCESNSFFQVSNDQNPPSQSLNYRPSIFRNNQQISHNFGRNKYAHNYGQLTDPFSNHGPPKLGHRKRTRKGGHRRNRTGRKKGRKHHKKQTEVHPAEIKKETVHILKKADMEPFSLPDVSGKKLDKTEFSFPVLNNPVIAQDTLKAEQNQPTSIVLPLVEHPIPEPKKDIPAVPQSPPTIINSVPVKVEEPPQKPVVESVKSPEPPKEVKLSPKAQSIPESWIRKDLKIEDVQDDGTLVNLIQEKRSNPSHKSLFEGRQAHSEEKQGGHRPPMLDFRNHNYGSDSPSSLPIVQSNSPPRLDFPVKPGDQNGPPPLHGGRTRLDFPVSLLPGDHTVSPDVEKEERVTTLEQYNQRCKITENMEQKKRCLDANKQEEVELERKAAEKPSEMDNLIDSGDKQLSPNKIKARLFHSIDQQNRKLAIATLTHAIYHIDDKPQEPANGFKLLELSRHIFSKICPKNVIPTMFFEMAVNGFKKLYEIVSPGRVEFITDSEFQLIRGILEDCHAKSEPPQYIQSSCREEIWAVNDTSNLICLGSMNVNGVKKSTVCQQTNIDVFDPLLDVIWLLFEGVKANCFSQFKGQSRLFHRFSLGIMDLFTRPLKYRWPLQNRDKIFWERILGPNLDLYLGNMDKCVHHIIDASPLDFRTPRFLNINSVRLSNSFMDFIGLP